MDQDIINGKYNVLMTYWSAVSAFLSALSRSASVIITLRFSWTPKFINTCKYHITYTYTHYKPIKFKLAVANTDTIRYDTIEEFNVDSKAEYSA